RSILNQPWARCQPQSSSHHFVGFRTHPLARNHSIASVSACVGGVCGRPSSRIALAGLNHILYFAMRTPAIGALGGLPVTLAIASFTCAAVSATKYGTRIF